MCREVWPLGRAATVIYTIVMVSKAGAFYTLLLITTYQTNLDQILLQQIPYLNHILQDYRVSNHCKYLYVEFCSNRLNIRFKNVQCHYKGTMTSYS